MTYSMMGHWMTITVALPVSAMMASLIDFMPQQAAATSIFSFSAGVIDAQPNQSGSIMALLDREDIGRGRTCKLILLAQVKPIRQVEYAAVDEYRGADTAGLHRA